MVEGAPGGLAGAGSRSTRRAASHRRTSASWLLGTALGGVFTLGIAPQVIALALGPTPPPPSVEVASTVPAGLRNAQLPPRLFNDAAGQPLPFESEADVLAFLQSAEIVSQSRYDEGGRPIAFNDANEFGRGTYLIRLRQDEVEVEAVFRSIEDRLGVARFVDGSTEVHFRDSGLFECAAYQLSELLGVHLIPPAVKRQLGPVEGSMQIVIAGSFDESARASGELADPSSQRWNKQLATMNVFDALIANGDRNRSNLLYDASWRVWLTDHSRAFRVSTRLDEAPLQAIERTLWTNLSALTAEAIGDAVGDYLSENELGSLLERRDRLVAHFASLIEQRGENMVVYGY